MPRRFNFSNANPSRDGMQASRARGGRVHAHLVRVWRCESCSQKIGPEFKQCDECFARLCSGCLRLDNDGKQRCGGGC